MSPATLSRDLLLFLAHYELSREKENLAPRQVGFRDAMRDIEFYVLGERVQQWLRECAADGDEGAARLLRQGHAYAIEVLETVDMSEGEDELLREVAAVLGVEIGA